MSSTPLASLVETLETRRFASASVITTPIKLPTISIDAARVLHIDGTAGDDLIKIRKLSGGRTRINIASTLNRSDPNILIVFSKADSKRATVLSTVAADGTSTQTVLTGFSVKSGKYRTIKVDRSGGTDQASIVTSPSDPVSGHYNGSAAAWKQKLGQQLVAAANSKSTIAFFGDSHAERYPYFGRGSWESTFGNALDLGISGDSTQQLLARIGAGLFDNFKPDTLVLMFGTNNFLHPATDGSDAQIFDGAKAVIAALHSRLPATQLVMTSVFPHSGVGVNARIETLNASLAKLDNGGRFHFVNAYPYFVGNPIRHYYMNPDNHLNANGYALLTDLLRAELKQL